MKHLLIGLAVLLGTSIQAQQLPNGDFENWVMEPYGEEPSNWGELSFQLLNTILVGTIDSTILKSTDAYSGNFAMELRSRVTNGLTNDTIIPYVAVNLKNSDLTSAKMQIDSNLVSLSGYIKQDLVNVDSNSTTINVLVYSNGDISGVGSLQFTKDITAYEAFDIPISYLGEIVGDSIEVIILAGSGDKPVPGNIMVVDEFKLNYSTSAISVKETIRSAFNVYPNPFKDKLNVALEISSPKDFQIYDIFGALMITGQLNPGLNSIDLAALPSSTYIFKYENKSVNLIKVE